MRSNFSCWMNCLEPLEVCQPVVDILLLYVTMKKSIIHFSNEWFQCAFNVIWVADRVNKSAQMGSVLI